MLLPTKSHTFLLGAVWELHQVFGVCVCVCPEMQLDEEAYAGPSVSSRVFHVVTWMKNATAAENRKATERVMSEVFPFLC